MRLFEKYLERSAFTSYEDFGANFKLHIPERFNFGYDVVDELARTKPDKRAMLWTDESGAQRSFTFGEMSQLSNRAANYFLSCGIKKGDRVMLILRRHYQFWYAIVALHKIGAVAVPATHLLTKKDIVYRCDAANVRAILSTDDNSIADHIEAAAPECAATPLLLTLGKRDGWLDFDAGVEGASPETPPLDDDCLPQNSDMMLLYFTSGTTGMPKMVLHDFTYPLGHIVTAVYWHNVDPDGLHLTVAETGWAKSVWGKLYGQWLAEAAVFVYDHEKFVPSEMLDVITKYGVTTFCAPPTIYRYFIKEDLTKYDFSHLKYATTAGEPLNPEVYYKFLEVTGLKIMEIFGQTETTVQIGNFLNMEPRPGSLGKPSPGFDIDLIDESGKPAKWGENGEIVIRVADGKPAGMFMGYYNDPDMYERVCHDGMYHTGDIAWRDEEGYYWYVGRTDDVIKSSGYRIGPFEVESALMEHPAVLETAITGVPHPERGQIVKATVVLASGYEPTDELKRELQNHVKRTTAPYKYPREIEFVSELPKTISGKIRRTEIREKDKEKTR